MYSLIVNIILLAVDYTERVIGDNIYVVDDLCQAVEDTNYGVDNRIRTSYINSSINDKRLFVMSSPDSFVVSSPLWNSRL